MYAHAKHPTATPQEIIYLKSHVWKSPRETFSAILRSSLVYPDWGLVTAGVRPVFDITVTPAAAEVH